MAVKEVFGYISYGDLTGYGYLGYSFEALGRC